MQYENNADAPFRAYITNLGKYTEGNLVGEWVEFPTTREKLQETMERIGIGDKHPDGTVYEEIFIADYEYNIPGIAQLKLGEYENINELNYLAEKIDEIDDNWQNVFLAAVEVFGNDMASLINLAENLDKYTLYEGAKNDEELGMKLINDGDKKVPEWLQGYIDYEAYGRDEAINRGGDYSEYGYIEQNGYMPETYKGIEDIPDEDLVILSPDKRIVENIKTLINILSDTDSILALQTEEVNKDVTESVTNEEPEIEQRILPK